MLDYDNDKRHEVVRLSDRLIFAAARPVSGERPRISFVHSSTLTVTFLSGFASFLEMSANSVGPYRCPDRRRKVGLTRDQNLSSLFLVASNHDAAVRCSFGSSIRMRIDSQQSQKP